MDIIYLTTHGFAVRMVFQTGLLRQLTAAGLKVGIIVPDGKDPNLVNLCARDGVTLLEYPLAPHPRGNLLKSLRKYVVENIRQNPCLWDKHRETMRQRSAARRLVGRLGLGLGDVVQRLPLLRKAFLAAEQALLLRPAVVEYLRSLDTKMLVATYPVAAPEPELLLAARTLGIRTVLHLLSWDNITAKGHFQALADYYVAWGPVMREELMEYYRVQPERIATCGVPHFDLYFAPAAASATGSSILPETQGPTEPYLFFAMSAARYAPGETAILRQLCKETRSGGRLEGMKIVARPHPSALAGVLQDEVTMTALEELRREFSLRISYPLLVKDSKMNWSVRDQDMLELVELLRGARVVINSGSTVAVEALALGRPVIITAYDGPEELPYEKSARRLIDYPHMHKFVADGGAVVVTDHEALLDSLTELLAHPAAGAAARAHALRRQIGPQNGGATEAVVQSLLAWLPPQADK